MRLVMCVDGHCDTMIASKDVLKHFNEVHRKMSQKNGNTIEYFMSVPQKAISKSLVAVSSLPSWSRYCHSTSSGRSLITCFQRDPIGGLYYIWIYQLDHEDILKRDQIGVLVAFGQPPNQVTFRVRTFPVDISRKDVWKTENYPGIHLSLFKKLLVPTPTKTTTLSLKVKVKFEE